MYLHLYTHTFSPGKRSGLKTVIISITHKFIGCGRPRTPKGAPMSQFYVSLLFIRVAFNW